MLAAAFVAISSSQINSAQQVVYDNDLLHHYYSVIENVLTKPTEIPSAGKQNKPTSTMAQSDQQSDTLAPSSNNCKPTQQEISDDQSEFH